MVILIGGISCTGKTLMAQTLLETYKISYLSLDHLKMGLFRGDPNCEFTPMDEDELISIHMWPIIKGIIMTAIENKQHLIIEGCYLEPRFIEDFDPSYREKILAVFLGFSTHYIKNKYTTDIIANRHVIEKRLYPEDRTAMQFIEEHQSLRKRCMAHKVNYFEIEQDYDAEIKVVYNYIHNAIDLMNSRL